MTIQLYNKEKSTSILMFSSFIALSGALMSSSSWALDDEKSAVVGENTVKKSAGRKARKVPSEDGLEEVIITGSKINLMDAQEMKRNAGTMMDAISADEIGLLPDRSTLDAMQRLPGVAIERFAAPNDPDHFGVEGSDIILRGMSQTRSEFNGRDSFSAHSGRGLSYKDVPPELLGSIQVFKNQTADMVEGGIGGTVNLITRKPFDDDSQVIAFSVDGSYGDLAETWGPTFSGLYSDIFETTYGRWGVLANYVDSTLVGQSHGIQSDAYVTFKASSLVADNDPNPIGRRAEDFVGEDGNGVVQVPNAANALMKEDERKRKGFAGAIEFESADESLHVVFEVLRSDSTLAWNERAIKYQGGFYVENVRPTAPLTGTHFLFDENGLFEAGTLVEEAGTWRSGPTGSSRIPTGSGPNGFRQWGHKTQMDSRVNETRSLVEDYSLNITWQATDKLELQGDLHYAAAEAEVDDLSIHLATRAMYQYDVRGSLPSLRLIEPWQGLRDRDRANGDPKWDAVVEGDLAYPGFGGDPLGDTNYFQDDDSYLWSSAMDHYERSSGDAMALKLDLGYQLDFGIVNKVKLGYRFSQREQEVRATSWNWGSLAPEWIHDQDSNWDLPEEVYQGEGIGWLPDVTPLQDGYEFVNWSDFMGGGVISIPGNQTIHANEALIRSVMGANPSRHLYSSEDEDNWIPYPERDGVLAEHGIFTPDEINTTLETRDALYVQLDFGGEGELKFSGNLGLRYVKMERQARGVVDFPVMVPIERNTQNLPPAEISLPLTPQIVDDYFNQQVADGIYENYDKASTAAANNWVGIPYFYLPNEVRGFAQGIPVLDENGLHTAVNNRLPYRAQSESLVARDDYATILPSFNIKVDLTSSLVGRFAFAKSIAFPDMADVRNRTEFDNFVATRKTSDDIVIEYRQVQVEGVPPLEMIDSVTLNRKAGDLAFVGSGGNPAMKPMESVQYDFSLEWYFSDYGQLSGAIFHKNLSNYFSRGVITREFTNSLSGFSQQVAVTSNHNGGDAKLDGVEINYHQFFDGFWEGFGIQATYTYIDANSVPNNEKNVEDEQWFSSLYEDTGIRVNPDKLPLQGVSDQIINLIGLFENDKWSARLAYNWRSKYLLTTRDVISKAPLWYDDHGELDGSVFYTITDNFSVGFQAENLTNETSKTIMILNDDLVETGRTWFVSDRRFALVLRGEF